MSKADNDSFSARQEQVLLLASKGLADKQIAIELGVSIATVHTYWSRLRKKFDGGNRAELVTLALHRNATETLTAKESENLQLIGEVVRRAQAEKDLEESQARLQAIIDNTPEAVFVKDRYGRYTLVNKVFQEMVGRDRESILGSRDHDLFGTALGSAYQNQDQRVLETREPVDAEMTLELPEGTRHYLAIKFPLIDSDDNVYAVGGFARDVTTRTEFERQLQASELRYRTLIENSTDAIMLLDKSGRILYASPSTKDLLGLGPEELVGKNAFHYIDRTDLTRTVSDFRGLVENPGSSIESSYWLLEKDGGRRYVEGRGTSFGGDSGVEVLLNYRDITSRELSTRRLSAKNAVAKSLAESPTTEDALPAILKGLGESLDCDLVAFWRVNGKKLEFESAFHRDKPGMDAFLEATKTQLGGAENTFPSQVWKEGMAVWESKFTNAKYARSGEAGKARLKTAIGFPVVAGSEILAIIEAFATHSAPVDKEFLKGLAVIGHQIGQFMKRKEAETEELRLAKELANVSADLKSANEALERRVKIRTIELEEVNARLNEEVLERKRSEEDLLNLFHFAQSVVLNSPDGIMGFDRRFNVTAWNESMERVTGVSREDVLGQCAFELFPSLMESGEDELFRQTLKGEKQVREEASKLVKSKEEKHTLSFEPVRNDCDEVIGGIVIVHREASLKDKQATPYLSD